MRGAIRPIDTLFIVSMVRSRLSQRLIRARMKITRRRVLATRSLGHVSLSDTEQVRTCEQKEGCS